MFTISYLGLPCGDGKTEIIISNTMLLVLQGQPVVLAVPTGALITDIVKRYNAKGAGHTVCPVHTNTHPGTVLSTANSELADPKPRVLIITHKTLGMLGEEHRNHWRLYIDEEPQTAHYHPGINLSEKYTEFLEMVAVKPDRYSDYVRLRLTDDPQQIEKAHRWAVNSLDDTMVRPLEDLIREVVNPHINISVSKHNWNNFTNADKAVHVLNPVGFTSPSALYGWKSVCISAAMFEQTYTYRLWSRLGVSFVPYVPLVPLPSRGTPPTRPVEILFFSMHEWTRSRINDLGGMEAVFSQVKTAFPDDCVMLAFANRKDQSPIIATKDSRTVEFGLVKSWGIGSFATQTNVVCLDVVNPPPEFWRFTASKHGLSQNEIRVAFQTLSYYQQVMRSNARVFGSTEPLRIVVPDKHTAEWLKENVFYDAMLSFMSTELDPGIIGLEPKQRRKPGRKAVGQQAMSNTERSRVSRARAKETATKSATCRTG